MSFSRAKLSRFNDKASDVPSPTRYDPKLGEKGKGGAFSKTERERTVSLSSADGIVSTGTPFRTPFSSVKKHSCVPCSIDKPSIVARPLAFNEHIMNQPTGVTVDQNSALNLTDALDQSHKLAEQLREENKYLQEQKAEIESRLVLLNSAKAELECVVANNQNCEKQVSQLTIRVQELEGLIEKLNHDKIALMDKLEDGKIDFDTRILRLETMLEQVKLEHALKVEEVAKLTETSEKLKITNECLLGKVSSLESEVVRLEHEMSEKEQTIFGLEEKASSLNSLLDAARTETMHQQNILTNLSAQLKNQEESCRLHEKTVSALDLQIDEKQKELDKISVESSNTIRDLKKEINVLHSSLAALSQESEQKMNEILAMERENIAGIDERDNTIKKLTDNISELEISHGTIISQLQDQISKLQGELAELTSERERIVKAHEEEIFHQQNEWEKKMVQQIQEAEHALLEKDAILKLSELQQAKAMRNMREELEGMLRDAETEANRRQSAQLEAGEMVKAKFEARIFDLENCIAQTLQSKAHELAEVNERYEECFNEVQAHVKLLVERNNEITNLTSCNHKLTSRVTNMLEEIKLLNAENSEKSLALDEMTDKFKEQLKKNDMLSEQLGELDSKISTFNDELGLKINEQQKLREELTLAKDEINLVKLRNIDLQLLVTTQENRANGLSTDLDTSRANFKSQLVDLNSELSNVKAQCYKFEIALANTRNSLDELGKRLIESECEIDRLLRDNEDLRNQLSSVENEKNETDNKFRLILEVKIELEQRLKDADETEKVMQQAIKDLELKNCDFELTKNELAILKSTLDEDKRAYEEALSKLQTTVTEKNLQMVQIERECLNQIEEVSNTLVGKIEEFESFAAERIQKLNYKIEVLTTEKKTLVNKYQTKCDEFDALNTDYDILKTTIEIAAKENEHVKEDVERKQINLQHALDKITEMDSEKAKMIVELESANLTLTNLKLEISDKTNEKNALNQVMTEQTRQIFDLQSELTAKVGLIEELTSKLSTMQQDFDAKLMELTRAKDFEVEQLHKEQKIYQTKLLTSMDENIKLLDNLEAEGRRISDLEESNKLYSQKVNALIETLEDERLLKEEAFKTLSNIKTELTESETANAQDKKEIARLSFELQCAKESTEWKSKWQSLLEEKEAMAAELLSMTEKKDHYKFHCQNLEKKANAADLDYVSAAKDFENLEGVLQDKQAEIARLQKRVAEFESLIGPFREQLEMYETERLMLENDRDQLRKQHLDQAAKLGHQNHKQKIQHVVRLKEDILQLRNENQKLQCKLKTKNKIIEELRSDLGDHPKRLFVNGKRPTSTPFKGKENDERLSPLPTRVKQEAMSPSNPLRERNQ